MRKALTETTSALTEGIKGKKPEDVSDEQKEALKAARAKQVAATAPQHYLVGCLLVAENKPEEALEVLERIRRDSWANPVFPIRLGNLYLSLGRDDEAEECFRKALEIDPQSSRAYQGLMKLMLKIERYREAAEYGLHSVGLLYFAPMTHYLLGKALNHLGYFDRAEEAFKAALEQNPKFVRAYDSLANLYRTSLPNPEEAERCQRRAWELAQKQENPRKSLPAEEKDLAPMPITERLDLPESWPEKEIITIVSGLPRSGTSLMMQMLDAGGLTCLCDMIREADENNPKGYFELESIKELHRNQSVLDDAGGKAVKIVAPIIPKLPIGENRFYRVIFIERDLDEVCASQAAMLKRLGKTGGRSDTGGLKRSSAKLVAGVDQFLTDRQIPTLRVSYGETIADPENTVRRLNRFCGGTLNEAAMAEVVDSSLHRERQGSAE